MNTHSLNETAGRDTACVHATCVSVQGQGLLIVGPSGSGKSGLALQMIALGAELVGDDRIDLRIQDDNVIADAVSPIRGLIEARGIGLLRAEATGPVPLAFVVDLEQSQPDRLPDPTHIPVLRQTVPLLHAAGVPNLAASLMQLLKLGRVDPQWPNT